MSDIRRQTALLTEDMVDNDFIVHPVCSLTSSSVLSQSVLSVLCLLSSVLSPLSSHRASCLFSVFSLLSSHRASCLSSSRLTSVFY
jgi:hypothetical protein